ncbi:MAG TPA: hypothetical protein VFO84_08400 [Dehalococcoidia bacterium]|nr:hypothetical protein [Dehalococcoidia bacterium]
MSSLRASVSGLNDEAGHSGALMGGGLGTILVIVLVVVLILIIL